MICRGNPKFLIVRNRRHQPPRLTRSIVIHSTHGSPQQTSKTLCLAWFIVQATCATHQYLNGSTTNIVRGVKFRTTGELIPALALNALIPDTEITTVCSKVVDGLITTQVRGLIANEKSVDAGDTAKAGCGEVPHWLCPLTSHVSPSKEISYICFERVITLGIRYVKTIAYSWYKRHYILIIAPNIIGAFWNMRTSDW